MRPTPTIRLVFLVAALALAGALAAGSAAAVERITLAPAPPRAVTIFLVRHAEKGKDKAKDPSLSEAGQQRARRLAEILAHETITHLFSTPLKRTRETLAPLAAARDLPVSAIMDVDDQVAALLDLPAGATAVVAGHSNTVPALVEGLGGTVSGTVPGRSGPQLEDGSYDRLFVVILAPPTGSSAPRLLRVLQLRYGAPSVATGR